MLTQTLVDVNIYGIGIASEGFGNKNIMIGVVGEPET